MCVWALLCKWVCKIQIYPPPPNRWHFIDISPNRSHLIYMHRAIFVYICVQASCPQMQISAVYLAQTWGYRWQKASCRLYPPATAQRKRQPVCTQKASSYMCLPGHIFRAWHSSPHTCQHFLSLSSLFCWMLVIIVLITSQCAAEISLKAVAWLTSAVIKRTNTEQAGNHGCAHSDQII